MLRGSMSFAVAETLVEERRYSVPYYRPEGGTIELRRISSCLGQLSRSWPGTPVKFNLRDTTLVPKQTAGILRTLNLTEPMRTKYQCAGHSCSSHALPSLPPIGSSHRPAPQQPPWLKDPRSSLQHATSSPLLIHPALSAMRTSLREDILKLVRQSFLPASSPFSTQHLFNPHSPYSSWSLGTSCRSPLIGADLPLMPLFLPPHIALAYSLRSLSTPILIVPNSF